MGQRAMNQMQLLLLTDVEKGYLAGFFDGEGCIAINVVRKKNYINRVASGSVFTTYRLHVRLASTDYEALEWLLELVGGAIYDHYGKGDFSKRGNRKAAWVWHLGGPQARPFLEMLSPLCRIKKRQIALALDFLNLGRACAPEQREEFYHQFRALNARGLTPYERESEPTSLEDS